MATSRLQRWAVILAAYDFEIKHIKRVDNAVADVLSRVISVNQELVRNNNNVDESYTYLNYVTNNVPSINSHEISIATEKDSTSVKSP